jgi:hypothetical protein
VRVAFATCSAMPDGAPDDHETAALLGAEYAIWSDPGVGWHDYDRVLLRSVWDYTWNAEAFLAWCDAVGPERLRNPPELIAFNADKRYLTALPMATVPTIYVAPGDELPALAGEVVVKPNISGGARMTGRFRPQSHDDARTLVATIQAAGRVAMVQPFLPAVERDGETALVFLGGELSHVLRKRPVLREDGIAPVADHKLQVAAVMFEDDLVVPAQADERELAFAHSVIDEISERFGTPVYARVDLLRGDDGTPVLLELEAVEPALYLGLAPGSAERLAAAVLAS